MSRFVAFAAIVACASAAPANTGSAFVYGHAAYTYGPLHCSADQCAVMPSCNKAHWKPAIGAFNEAASSDASKIKTIYSYGGDVEFWPINSGSGNDTQSCWAPASDNCNYTSYFEENNHNAAVTYKSTSGVEQVVALLDARMDGWDMITHYNNFDACNFGDFYPNLANLTDVQLGKLAKQTAKLYCTDDTLGGIQIDLEPYAAPYQHGLETFLKAMVSEMEDADGSNNCRNAAHPNGRTTSYFCFAHSVAEDFAATNLGTNGYFVFSGYDLFPLDIAFSPNNVTQFKNNLQTEVASIKSRIAGGAKFTLAVPIAASCHEYEQYIPMHGDGCGPACEPHDSGHKMHEYVTGLFDVLEANLDVFKLVEGGQFLGLSFWVWTFDMTYPPMKWFNNLFVPGTPSDETLAILKARLPNLS